MDYSILLQLALSLLIAASQPNVPIEVKNNAIEVANYAIVISMSGKEIDSIEERKKEETKTIEYTFKKGDTFTSVARQFKTTIEELWTLNAIEDLNAFVGRKIIVPSL